MDKKGNSYYRKLHERRRFLLEKKGERKILQKYPGRVNNQYVMRFSPEKCHSLYPCHIYIYNYNFVLSSLLVDPVYRIRFNKIKNILKYVSKLLIDNNYKGESYLPTRYIERICTPLKYKEILEILYENKLISGVKIKHSKYNGKRYYKILVTRKLLKGEIIKCEDIKTIKKIWNNLHHKNHDSIPLHKPLSQFEIKISDTDLKKELDAYSIKNPDKEISYLNELKNEIKIWNDNRLTDKIHITNDKSKWANRRHTIFSYRYSFLRKYTNPKVIELDAVTMQPLLLALVLYKLKPDNSYSAVFTDPKKDIYKIIGGGDRNKGKNLFMSTVYGPFYFFDNIFKELFPDSYDIIISIKKGFLKDDFDLRKMAFNNHHKQYSKNQQGLIEKLSPFYKALPLMITKMEVKIFERIWRRLIKKNILFIPVHDAIYVRRKNKKEVLTIMNEEFEKEFINTPLIFKIK